MDVVVVLGGLVAGATGAVEATAGVDARGGDVAAVLARQRIAGAAFRGRRRRGSNGQGGGAEEGEGGEDGEGLHLGVW